MSALRPLSFLVWTPASKCCERQPGVCGTGKNACALRPVICNICACVITAQTWLALVMGCATLQILARPCARLLECSSLGGYSSTSIFTGRCEEPGENYFFGICGTLGDLQAGCGIENQWCMGIWPHRFECI